MVPAFSLGSGNNWSGGGRIFLYPKICPFSFGGRFSAPVAFNSGRGHCSHEYTDFSPFLLFHNHQCSSSYSFASLGEDYALGNP